MTNYLIATMMIAFITFLISNHIRWKKNRRYKANATLSAKDKKIMLGNKYLMIVSLSVFIAYFILFVIYFTNKGG